MNAFRAGLNDVFPFNELKAAGNHPGFPTGRAGSHGGVNFHNDILVGGLEHFLFSHMLGIIIPID